MGKRIKATKSKILGVENRINTGINQCSLMRMNVVWGKSKPRQRVVFDHEQQHAGKAGKAVWFKWYSNYQPSREISRLLIWYSLTVHPLPLKNKETNRIS